MELGSYSVLSVEAPQVPVAELRSAIRWQIKDLIDFHIDDAVLDVFDAPASGADHKQHNLYVVVSKLSRVKERVSLLQDAYVNLTTIDIPELVLRNISTLLPEDPKGVAFVYLQRRFGVLILTRQSSLYLARTLDIGYESLLNPSGETPDRIGGEVNSQFDKLVLELQRSFDYFDRYFMLPPLSGVVLAPLPQPVPGLVDYLGDNLGIACRELDLDEILQFKNKLDRQQQAAGLLAIGAALRQERAVL
jgi:MSHA biogenesis protein MshI